MSPKLGRARRREDAELYPRVIARRRLAPKQSRIFRAELDRFHLHPPASADTSLSLAMTALDA